MPGVQPGRKVRRRYNKAYRDQTLDNLPSGKKSQPIPAPRSKRPVIKDSEERKTFKCIECDHQELIEDNLIRHMENKHITLFNQESSEPTNQESYNCRKCDHSTSSKELQRQHIQVKHGKYVNSPNWFMIGDSHLNSVKPWMVEKATGGKLFCPGSIHPKEGRAYCSTRQWPNAKFPHNNHTDMVPKLLSQRPFKGGAVGQEHDGSGREVITVPS